MTKTKYLVIIEDKQKVDIYVYNCTNDVFKLSSMSYTTNES